MLQGVIHDFWMLGSDSTILLLGAKLESKTDHQNQFVLLYFLWQGQISVVSSKAVHALPYSFLTGTHRASSSTDLGFWLP